MSIERLSYRLSRLLLATGAVIACSPARELPREGAGGELLLGTAAAALSERCNEGPGHVPDRGERFNRAVEYVTDEMNVNEAVARDTILQLILAGNRPLALLEWARRVRPGGDWDHKPKLRDLFGMSLDREETLYMDVPSGESEIFYDVWSNIHYGYVGTLAGFTRTELQEGAALSDGVAGVNDPGDVLTIDIGIDLANELGASDLSPDAVGAAFLARLEPLRAATCYHVRSFPSEPPVPIECFVFNDGYSDMAGPSDAVFFRGPRQACIPDGSSSGACRKWFGRCRTRDTHEPVDLNTFNYRDEGRVNGVDALFAGPGGESGDLVCAPDGTREGTCGIAFFVSGVSGRRSWCRLFDDGYTRSVYESEFMSPSGGSVCDIPGISDDEVEPTCRKWFGCEADALPGDDELGEGDPGGGGQGGGGGTPPPPLAVSAGSDVAGVEGSAIALSGSVSGGVNPTVAWSWRRGAGSQSNSSCTIADASALATTITCNDDGNYIITLTARDGARTPKSDSIVARVTNAPPELTLEAPLAWQVYRAGTPVELSAPFTDPGRNDSHTCDVDWDDGTTEAYGAAPGACDRTHTFERAGMYTLAVRVTDDDGAADEGAVLIVVYDPEGPFSNADGSIASNGGWPIPNPHVQSETWFHLAARYYGNASTPTGNAQSWLPGTDFRIDSGSAGLLWLVATDDGKIAARGTCRLEGRSGDYGFVFYGYDGCSNGHTPGCQPGPDAFRIVVWDRAVSAHPGAGNLYDNAPDGGDDVDEAEPLPLRSGIVTLHPPT
jgi:hypothetical protein